MKRREKQFPTDRIRRPNQTIERRTNAWAANVGYLTGRGFQSPEIASVLHDGTSSDTVRRMWKLWGLARLGKAARAVHVPVRLSAHERRVLAQRASRKGISAEEWLRRLAVCAIADDLYNAVTDGRFDR